MLESPAIIETSAIRTDLIRLARGVAGSMTNSFVGRSLLIMASMRIAAVLLTVSGLFIDAVYAER